MQIALVIKYVALLRKQLRSELLIYKRCEPSVPVKDVALLT